MSPTGAEIITREIDFQLGPQMGIEVFSVIGSCPEYIGGESSAFESHLLVQTLHAAVGTLETVATENTEDEDQIDSEIFFRQDILKQSASATGTGLVSVTAMPNGVVTFPEPYLLARNFTHRGESPDAAVTGILVVVFYYRYVVFTLSELGLILGRR